MPEQANAFPRKHFFLEMFTRDISLEDCILDLIDNSIDALVKTQSVDISTAVFKRNGATPNINSLPLVQVTFSSKEVKVVDNCGGIGFLEAKNDVFNFGHGDEPVRGQLGAYGIGLKRALFKIGNDFLIESHSKQDGFSAHLQNIRKWSEADETLEDWKIPIKPAVAATSTKNAGTAITIRDLREEVRMRISDASVAGRLQALISKTYALFLNRHVRVSLNSKPVMPFEIPIGQSREVTPGHDEFEDDGVKVKLFASLSAQPKADTAGWYVLCNGRVVVHADKTELTGWGAGLPQFHTKFVRFLGLAFFQSRNPLLLPWTTTKRGLNRESRIFQKARNRMAGLSQPILKFLSSMYPTELVEEPKERQVADTITAADLRKVASQPKSVFKVAIPAKSEQPRTVRIQYNALRADVDRIRTRLRRPSMPANQAGKHNIRSLLENRMPAIGSQIGSSFGVQYDLRPAKQVERRMVIDACQLLSLANFPIRDYQYTGFGSFYFVDFILFHKLLGIRDMLSLERDARIAKRVKYNRPYACIELQMLPSTVVIPTLSPDKKHILWLDYDSVLSAGHIMDARLAGTYLTPGSLLVITVDVEPPGDDQDGPTEWKQHFHDEAGELALSFDQDIDFAESKLVSVNTKLLERAINAGMMGRAVEFSPLFNFLYADGHQMLTIGGMITTETERRQLRASKLDQTEYVRTSLSKKPFSIYVPRVTRKERLHLDPRMPSRKKWRPKRFEMPSRDVQAYRQIFPFLPAYAELLL